MLSPSSKPPFTPLPNEQVLYTSPQRIALSLSTPAHYPGKQQALFTLSHSTGIIYLTNRRIIYIPDKPTDRLQSFAAPLLNLHDSHVTAPFFGPNVWIALLQPVSGGGIPVPSTGVVEIKLTFKEGGAFDFHTHYERTRERLQQVVENAREAGGGATAPSAVNTASVNLEDLPAYQEESDGPLMSPTAAAAAAEQRNSHTVNSHRGRGGDAVGNGPPAEPPPGYEP